MSWVAGASRISAARSSAGPSDVAPQLGASAGARGERTRCARRAPCSASLEIDERADFAIKGEERDFVLFFEVAQEFFRACLGFRPELLAAHARAAVEQDHGALERAAAFERGDRAVDEWAREAKRKEDERERAEEQQEDVFEPAPLGDARRRRPQEHERLKWRDLARGAADEVEEDRQRDAGGAEEEERGEEAHGLLDRLPPPHYFAALGARSQEIEERDVERLVGGEAAAVRADFLREGDEGGFVLGEAAQVVVAGEDGIDEELAAGFEIAKAGGAC